MAESTVLETLTEQRRQVLHETPLAELFLELATRGVIWTVMGCPHCDRDITIKSPWVLVDTSELKEIGEANALKP